jgi:hypothetical protein
MIGLNIKTTFNAKPLAQAAQKAKFKNLSHAAAAIRKTEIASFIPSNVASAPGTPPHTRIRIVKRGKNKGGQFPRSVAFDVQGDSAVIGPRASVVGTSAKAHEFGGSYKGTIFPERSFAKPALQENVDRFADSFEGSI